jgi:hypothetical protein
VLYPAVSGNGIFSYSADLSKLSAVAVYSIDGKLMASLSSDALLHNQQIDLSSLNNGLYFVSLTKEGKTSTQKIVISR